MADAGPVRDQALGILATAASGPVVETSLEVQTGQAGPVVESDLSIVTDGYYVYDVIVMKGAYNAEVARWMQMQRAWLPASVSTENVLALYDPNADKLFDFGGLQVLTDSGMHQVTYALTSTGLRYARFKDNSYLSGSPYGTSLGSIGTHTIYAVCSNDDAITGVNNVFYPLHLTAPDAGAVAGAGFIQVGCRRSVWAPNSWVFMRDELVTAYAGDSVSGLALKTVVQQSHEITTTTFQSWQNQTSTAGQVAHSLDPGSAVAFDQLDIGGKHNQTGDTDGSLLYLLVVSGARSATTAAEIAARFPIGEVLP